MSINAEITGRLNAILDGYVSVDVAMKTPLARLVESILDAHAEVTRHAAALSAIGSDIETGGDSRGLTSTAAALESAQATYRAAWAALGPAAACLVAGIKHGQNQ